jgi:hypothetical protein
MSCIHFGAVELGNVARVISEKSHDPGVKLFEVCTRLALISKANTKAFKSRYPAENPAPVTSDWIALEAKAPNRTGNLMKAVQTAGLLHYNCDEEENYLALTKGGMLALAEVLNDLLWAQRDALEASQKLVEAYSPGP